MCDVVVIKIYSSGKTKQMCGGSRADERLIEDTAIRILKENKIRNVGEFIVVSRAGSDGAFITEFDSGIGIGKGRVVWIGDKQVLIEALNRLGGGK